MGGDNISEDLDHLISGLWLSVAVELAAGLENHGRWRKLNFIFLDKVRKFNSLDRV